MKLFKNMIAYDFTRPLPQSKTTLELQQRLEAQLAEFKFSACTGNEFIKKGWSAPLGVDSEMFTHVSGDNMLLLYKQEKRDIPAVEVARRLEKKVAEIETAECRQVKKKERSILKEEIIFSLLPRAFSKFTVVPLWIDLKNQRLLVDANSHKKAEDAISLLRKTIGSLALVPFPAETADPRQVLTHWVSESAKTLPACYQLGSAAKISDLEGGSVTLKDCDLLGEEVQSYLASNMFVNSLAISWGNTAAHSDLEGGYFVSQVSFTLTDGLILKAINLTNIDEQLDDIELEDFAAHFDAEFTLVAGTLAQLLDQMKDDFSVKSEDAA